MTTEYIRTCHEEVNKGVTESLDSGNVFIEISDRKAESFAGFIQLSSEKTETILNITALVA